jgi:hypothetical protein
MEVYLVYGYDNEGYRVLLSIAASEEVADRLISEYKYDYHDCFAQMWKVKE